MGVHMGVCGCAQGVYRGAHGCVQACTWVCTGVHVGGCALCECACGSQRVTRGIFHIKLCLFLVLTSIIDLVFVDVGGCSLQMECTTAYRWRSEDNPPCGSQDCTWVIGIGSKHLPYCTPSLARHTGL